MAGPSRSAIGRMVRDGAVAVNGRPPRKAGQALELGDVVVVRVTPDPEPAPRPGAPAPRVVYEDEHLLAIDKPAGLAVHPGPGHPVGTLVDRLIALGTPLSRSGGNERPGIVHRLDKETSGVMLIAKNDAAPRESCRAVRPAERPEDLLGAAPRPPPPRRRLGRRADRAGPRQPPANGGGDRRPGGAHRVQRRWATPGPLSRGRAASNWEAASDQGSFRIHRPPRSRGRGVRGRPRAPRDVADVSPLVPPEIRASGL